MSIVGSIAIYALHDENLGIFVGLWASALLLLGERMDVVLLKFMMCSRGVNDG